MAASREPALTTDAMRSPACVPPSSLEGCVTPVPASDPNTCRLDRATAWPVRVSRTQPPRVPENPALIPPGTGRTRRRRSGSEAEPATSGVGRGRSCTSVLTRTSPPSGAGTLSSLGTRRAGRGASVSRLLKLGPQQQTDYEGQYRYRRRRGQNHGSEDYTDDGEQVMEIRGRHHCL
jgi:hypothetical protein